VTHLSLLFCGLAHFLRAGPGTVLTTQEASFCILREILPFTLCFASLSSGW